MHSEPTEGTNGGASLSPERLFGAVTIVVYYGVSFRTRLWCIIWSDYGANYLISINRYLLIRNNPVICMDSHNPVFSMDLLSYV